jgi:hypothetical protein
MDDLQFERADFGAAPVRACAGCHQPIAGDYYDVNGQAFCPACRSALAQAHGAPPGAAAFGRALVVGFGAAAIGSTLYYLIDRITGYQLGLVAIAVGFLVGRAVRWGTGGRGGRLYQVLAVALTYAAISFSFLPYVLESNQTLGVADLPLLVPFIIALPIQLGMRSPFLLVIFGIGLWEAWKLTTPVRLSISGPFQASPSAARPPVAAPAVSAAPAVPAPPGVPPVPPAVP